MILALLINDLINRYTGLETQSRQFSLISNIRLDSLLTFGGMLPSFLLRVSKRARVRKVDKLLGSKQQFEGSTPVEPIDMFNFVIKQETRLEKGSHTSYHF